jgi:hypothetical protein
MQMQQTWKDAEVMKNSKKLSFKQQNAILKYILKM